MPNFPMHPDFVDLLCAFVDRDVRFMAVGAYALGVHGRPRARVGDIEVDVIGREAFVQNQRATARARDLGLDDRKH